MKDVPDKTSKRCIVTTRNAPKSGMDGAGGVHATKSAAEEPDLEREDAKMEIQETWDVNLQDQGMRRNATQDNVSYYSFTYSFIRDKVLT